MPCTIVGMHDDDVRYARPCRQVLAVAAGIHWVAAMLLVMRASNLASAESIDVYARWVDPVVTWLARSLG